MTRTTLTFPFVSAFPPNFQTELERLDRLVTRALANAELVACCSDRCREKATVEEIATGLEYCLPHFLDHQAVGRG